MALFDKTFFRQLRELSKGIFRNGSDLSKKISTEISQLSIQYKNSPAIDYDNTENPGSPQQGERAPDAIIDKSTRLYDFLRHPHHTLLLFIGETAESTTIENIKELQEWLHIAYFDLIKILIVANNKLSELDNVIIDKNNTLHQRYMAKNTTLYLIRPDNMIAYISGTPNKLSIEKFLANYLYPPQISG
jgi:hypothetical protein